MSPYDTIVVGGGIVTGDILNFPKVVSECSLVNKNGITTGVCSSDVAVDAVAEVLRNSHKFADDVLKDPKSIMTVAKKTLKCTDEKCVLTNKEVVDKLGRDQVRKELALNFKLDGPTDVSLLSNINLDGTLRQWQKAYNESHPAPNRFYAYNFNMVDYENEGDSLAKINMATDVYDGGYRAAACIINTDKYSGNGLHWMALFVDMRDSARWTIEFFNSAGNAPQKSYGEWMFKTRSQLEGIPNHAPIEIIKCSTLRHQNSRTECGVYALYYIWGRLMKNIPSEEFMKHRISDQVMFEFRQHLFNGDTDGTVDPRGIFDLRRFFERCRPKWETGGEPIEIMPRGGYAKRQKSKK